MCDDETKATLGKCERLVNREGVTDRYSLSSVLLNFEYVPRLQLGGLDEDKNVPDKNVGQLGGKRKRRVVADAARGTIPVTPAFTRSFDGRAARKVAHIPTTVSIPQPRRKSKQESPER